MFGTKRTGLLLILVLAFGLVSQSVKIIPEGRTGVIFNLKGGVEKKSLKEGIHFLIPFVQTLIIYDTRYVTYTFTNNPAEKKLGPAIVAKTNDGQIVGIEISLITRMIQQQAPFVYQKLRTDFEPVLKAKAGKIIQEVIASHVADALYTEDTRKAVTEETKEQLAQSFAASGFELQDVLLRKIDFSKEYIDAIERKQIALQKAELSKILKEISLKEKKIEIIKGEAEGKTVAIKGRAVQANPKVAELEYLEAIDSKNENDIPVIVGLKGNTFVNIDKLIK